jgi:hypothetical protein
MPKARIILEFKYPDQPWMKYDETLVPAWADVQEIRMKKAHPEAIHRVRVEGKGTRR